MATPPWLNPCGPAGTARKIMVCKCAVAVDPTPVIATILAIQQDVELSRLFSRGRDARDRIGAYSPKTSSAFRLRRQPTGGAVSPSCQSSGLVAAWCCLRRRMERSGRGADLRRPPARRNTSPAAFGNAYLSNQATPARCQHASSCSGSAPLSSFRHGGQRRRQSRKAAARSRAPSSATASGWKATACDRAPMRRLTFPAISRKSYGGVAGVGVTIAPGTTVGLSVDQSRTNIDVTGVGAKRANRSHPDRRDRRIRERPWNFGAMLVARLRRRAQQPFRGRRRVLCVPIRRDCGPRWPSSATIGRCPTTSASSPSSPSTGRERAPTPFAETGGATPRPGSSVTANRVAHADRRRSSGTAGS